jgi:hypothetical protein
VFLGFHLRGQWFWWDEFEYLGSARDGYSALENLLRPHNEHWSVLTGLSYGILRETVSLTVYWPYLVPVVAVHLLAMHLLWRLMRRLDVDPWIATAFAALFGLAGMGYENIVWAFQIAFVASTAVGLLTLNLVLRAKPLSLPRLAIVAALSLVNLATSGIGVIYLLLIGVLLWRTDRRSALMTVAGPLLVYAAWTAVYGAGPSKKSVDGLTFVYTLLEYVMVGVVSTVCRLIGVNGVETLAGLVAALAALGVGLVVVAVRLRRDGSLRLASIVALGAPAFFALAGSARVTSADSMAGAMASRYYYIVLPMVIPLIALLLSRLAARWRPFAIVATVGLFALVPVTAVNFAAGADKSRGESELTRRSFIAQADLLRSGVPVFSDNAPDPLKSPQYPSQDDLVRWSKDGQLHPLPLSAEDWATASAALQLRLTPTSTRPGQCGIDVAVFDDASTPVLVSVPARHPVGVVLVTDAGVQSRPRYEMLDEGVYVLTSKTGGRVELVRTTAVGQDATLCR